MPTATECSSLQESYLLMALSLLLTGCSAEEVDLAIDIADAVLDMALEEGDTPPPQTDKTPESSQAPPVEPTPPVEPAPPEEVPVETPEGIPEAPDTLIIRGVLLVKETIAAVIIAVAEAMGEFSNWLQSVADAMFAGRG